MKRLVLRLSVAAALATIATQPRRRDSLAPSDGWRAVDPAAPSASALRAPAPKPAKGTPYQLYFFLPRMGQIN